MVIDGQHLYRIAFGESAFRLRNDRIERGAALRGGEVAARKGLSPSRIDEMVEADARHALRLHQAKDVRDRRHVQARHRHAQPHLHATRDKPTDRRHACGIRPFFPAEGIMHLLRAVDGDAHISRSETRQPIRRLVIDERSVRGERDAQSFPLRIFGKLSDVRTAERFAAGKEQHWHTPRRKVFNHALRLIRAQNGSGTLAIGGVAVGACQIACGRHIPDHDGS